MTIWRRVARSEAWMLHMGVILMALVSSMLVVGCGPRSQVRDFYHSIEDTVGVTIDLTRVGILVRQSVVDSVFVSFTDSLGLSSRDTLGEAISTFRLEHTMSREDLVEYTRVIEERRPDLVAEAGMVVTIDGATRPLLVTDKFCVQFHPGVTKLQIQQVNAHHRVRVLEADSLEPNHYLLEVTGDSPGDAITVARRYQRLASVRYAHPNWVHVLEVRQYRPPDSYFADQWHHENTGQGGGTPDADIDTPGAWEITRRVTGGSRILIAVIDGGFDLGHPDLQANLWSNPDGSGTHGYDFYDCDGTAGPECGDQDPSWMPLTPFGHDSHGTPVAALAGAEWENGGVVGACPQAELMLIRRGFDEEHLARAFDFAHERGADIITCSWGYYEGARDPKTPTLHEAIERATNPRDGSTPSIVFFAMDYTGSGDCSRDGGEDLADHPSVIAVGSASNLDRRPSDVACGDYLDVLAPSSWGEVAPHVGTRNIVTADVMQSDGYNNKESWRVHCPSGTEIADANFTRCFSGTSAATPIAAGVAGLVLIAWDDGTREPRKVQQILQDTADKIEPSRAQYGPNNGFSKPTSTPGSTHGFGRVNATEAVRLVARPSFGGKGGIDLLLRDNPLDWGNSEQPSHVLFEDPDPSTPPDNIRGFVEHWLAPDIKVEADPTGPRGTAMSSAEFDRLTDEELSASGNRIHVRVRNRGPKPAQNARVKLFWARAGTAVPALPSNLWTNYNSNRFGASGWRLVGESGGNVVPYSGATAARNSRLGTGTDSDEAVVVSFEFTPPSGVEVTSNLCSFLAIVDAPSDHPAPLNRARTEEDLIPDLIAPRDNNIALRNVHVIDTSGAGETGGASQTFSMSFLIENPTSVPIETSYRNWLTKLNDANWTVTFTGEQPASTIALAPGASTSVTMVVTCDKPASQADIQLEQSWRDSTVPNETVRAGMTVRFRKVAN